MMFLLSLRAIFHFGIFVRFRLQRMHILAQSQPNLLDLLDNEDEANEQEEEEVRRDVATLSKALSNPNLLDSSSYQDSCKVLIFIFLQT